MKKYVVSRKNVYAGVLTKKIDDTAKICFNGEMLTLEDLRKQGLDVEISYSLRGMLFSLDEGGLANDLIYTTPTNYFIDGISKGHNFSEFTIDNYVRLDEVLKYLRYNEELTQRDLVQVYRRLIVDKRWLENNAELFGIERSNYNYANYGIETLPSAIYYNLECISAIRKGIPCNEEPGYSYIKKKGGF